MTTKATGRTQRAIVLQLLRDDRPQEWSHTELQRELSMTEPVVRDALAQLQADGVVTLDGKQVQPSPCARRLDTLDLIAI